MAKMVFIEDGADKEIIPDYALPVEKWYGEEFASNCVEAPEDVKEGLLYDPETKTFSKPPAPKPPEPDPITVLQNQLAQSDDAAQALFEAQAATDEAVIEIYEKIGGTSA